MNNNNNISSVCMMAFGKGQVSTESTGSIKRYIGYANVKVLAVNPNKKELEAIYNTTLDKEPEYQSTVDINGKSVPSVRLDFIVQTDAENCNGIDLTTKVSLFLRKQYRFNRDETKVQVIDKYGRTCWVTKEQCSNHEIPVYSNGPANIDKDYRPCYVGEEELTNFIKAYLGIPNVMKYVNNTWVMVDNPQDSEARLEEIEKYFSNNFSELRSVIALQPHNRVKVLFGVRTTNDNKQYQAVYTQMFLRSNANDNMLGKLDKDVQDRKANGAYATTEFCVCPLKEYVVEATNFNNTTSETPANLPWDF